jgi:hypothetical protein
VSGVAGMDRVHGEAASFVGGGGKCCGVHNGKSGTARFGNGERWAD